MSYQLRDYQTDLLDRINKSWFSGTRSLVCQIPTGGGKTILFATVVHEANQNGLKSLVLAHREELILGGKPGGGGQGGNQPMTQ